MKKAINEYGTDVEGVTKAWDWAQQKVIALIPSWNNLSILAEICTIKKPSQSNWCIVWIEVSEGVGEVSRGWGSLRGEGKEG